MNSQNVKIYWGKSFVFGYGKISRIKLGQIWIGASKIIILIYFIFYAISHKKIYYNSVGENPSMEVDKQPGIF